MRRLLFGFVSCFLLILVFTNLGFAQQKYEFKLGFKALADQIPDVVGDPLENEHWGANGDSIQKTSKGLMVWRKADNWTAFTNGSRTWINGPFGIQERGNLERFDWEEIQATVDEPRETAIEPTPSPTPQPTATDTQVSLTDGSFIKGGGPQIYMMLGGSKHLLHDWNTFLRFGGKADLSNVQILSDAMISAIPTGSPIGEPTLVPTPVPVPMVSLAPPTPTPDNRCTRFSDRAAIPPWTGRSYKWQASKGARLSVLVNIWGGDSSASVYVRLYDSGGTKLSQYIAKDGETATFVAPYDDLFLWDVYNSFWSTQKTVQVTVTQCSW